MWWYSCMHRSVIANIAILHHWDDDIDLLYHFNVLVSLFSLVWLPSSMTYVIRKTIHRNLNDVQYSNDIPCLKVCSISKTPMEKTWFYEFLWIFRSGNRHGKRLKKCSIKEKMLIKISCMHYMTWTRVMLPIVFELFIFFGYFASFHYRKHLCQSLLFNKFESLRPVTLLKKRLQKLQKTQKLCLRLWTQIQATGMTACRSELSVIVLQLMKKNIC